MAITILSEPSNGEPVVRAYQPLMYRVQAAPPAFGLDPIKLKVTVYINGVNVKEFYVSHIEYDGIDYYFDINIQEFVANYFLNSLTFTAYGAGNVNGILPFANSASPMFLQRCDFAVELETMAANVVLGGYWGERDNVISNEQSAINASMRDRDRPDLTAQITIFPSDWLTNYRNNAGRVVRISRLNEHISLGYYSLGDSREGLRIRTYDNAGNQIAIGYIKLDQAFESVKRVRRLLVGAQNINNTVGAQWSGTPVVINANVQRYTLEVIDNYTAPLGSQIALTETATVYVELNRCTGVKLYFLNAWGMEEWIEFDNVGYDYESTQTNYRANFDGFIQPALRGNTTLNSFAQRSMRLRKTHTENEAEYNQLQELVNSPVVFLCFPNSFALNAVTIREGSVSYEQKNSINEINLTVDFANLDLSQTN